MTKTAVLVTGSRTGIPPEEVQYRMLKYPAGTVFIHGDAAGVDKKCSYVCLQYGYPEVRVPYLSHLGKAGGPVRNGIMLEILRGLGLLGYAISVEAFPSPESRGTKDMIKMVQGANVPIHIYGKDDRDK